MEGEQPLFPYRMLTEFAFPYSFAGSFAGIAIISAVIRKSWKWIGWFGLVSGVFFLPLLGSCVVS